MPKKIISFIMLVIVAMQFIFVPVYAAKSDKIISETASKSSGPTRGIDVSKFQGRIDWAKLGKLKKKGIVTFAIIKAVDWKGDSNTGSYVFDEYFDYNVRQAKKYGIKVGVYIFTYAFNRKQMAQEVKFFTGNKIVRQHKRDGIKYDLPVFIDYESELIIKNTTSKEQRTDTLRYGMRLLKKKGFTPGFYSNTVWATRVYDAQALQNEGYDFWLARYNNYSTKQKPNQHRWAGNQPAIWQFSSIGRLSGIKTNVDLNYCYKNYKFNPLPKKNKK